MNDLPNHHPEFPGEQAAPETNATEGPDVAEKKRAGREKKHFTQFIFRDWCKSCGICSAFCPKGVIGKSDTGTPVIEHPDACIGCRFCELHCPDFAITIREKNGEPTRNGT